MPDHVVCIRLANEPNRLNHILTYDQDVEILVLGRLVHETQNYYFDRTNNHDLQILFN